MSNPSDPSGIRADSDPSGIRGPGPAGGKRADSGIRGPAGGKRADSGRQFSTLSTIDGYEVIDNRTGRPVGFHPSAQKANQWAYRLNGAAADGPEALIAALGGREPKRRGGR